MDFILSAAKKALEIGATPKKEDEKVINGNQFSFTV